MLVLVRAPLAVHQERVQPNESTSELTPPSATVVHDYPCVHGVTVAIARSDIPP